MSKKENISSAKKSSNSQMDFSSLKELNSSQILGLIVFVGLLAIPYIYNSHLSDKKHRRSDKIKADVKELRAEYITLKSDIVSQNKQSDVSIKLADKGLTPISEAPINLNIEDN
jgi:hypothetical protein